MSSDVASSDLSALRKSLEFWLQRWRGCPLAYVLEMIGDVPTHQQAEILRAFERHSFVAVASGHGIGKTKLMAWLINWWLDTRGKMAPVTGAGGEQLGVTVWKEVSKVAKGKWPWFASRYNILSTELQCRENPSEAKAVLRTVRAENDDALQGFHDCMFFIDEGSGVRDGIFEVASGAFGDPGNCGFMAGNPTKTSGYMYQIFHERSFWHTLQFSSEDSMSDTEYEYPYVDPFGEIRMLRTRGRQTRQWVQDFRDKYGVNSNVYRIRVLGQFANLGADYLVLDKWLEGVFGGAVPSEKRALRRLGVDPAWTGEDDTGIVIREGDAVVHAESRHGFDLVETFDRVRHLFHDWRCDEIAVDAVGVGAGLYDMLNHAVFRDRIGYPVVKVMVSERPPEDREAQCKTLRDWLWWRCRLFFRTRHVRFCGEEEDPCFSQLRREVIEPTYKLQGGKIVAESKDDMKKRGLKSPNLADALNLTFLGDEETFADKTITQGELERRLYGRRRHVSPLNWKVL